LFIVILRFVWIYHDPFHFIQTQVKLSSPQSNLLIKISHNTIQNRIRKRATESQIRKKHQSKLQLQFNSIRNWKI